MQAVGIIVAAIAILIVGYVFYGNWLVKQWGVDPSRKTPAQTMEDGVDYVAAKPAVLMGHHFSSIAGAGPINGPIQASVFGWVPVFLWCVFGGIFFGGLHDFGSLFASIRHDGKGMGEIIKDTMGKRAGRLFIIFALLVLILVIASFVNVVAGTFMSDHYGISANPSGNETTAMISMLFIALAVVYGVATNRFGLGVLPATICGIVCICLMLVMGLNVGLAMPRVTWIVLICAYITIASLVPVWILLQPRDYLSSFLLYGMMIVAVVGILISGFTGSATFEIPAFNLHPAGMGPIFPTLFITVACGACSGFHSLVATGTTSKQLNSEADAKPIGYGAMLIESALGVVSLIAVGMVFTKYVGKEFGSPSAAFAAGIATMFGEAGTPVYNTLYALLTLAVSVFALTSLDTATRLSRFMFSELFLKEGEATWRDATGVRRLLTHPLVGTLIMVVIGGTLGGLQLSQIWGLFGAANQLLSGLALLAVAAWLGNVGKNNKMFLFPMAFMLVATLSSLCLTILAKISLVGNGGAAWGDWFQLVFATAMAVLAVVLAAEGIRTMMNRTGVKAA